MKSKLFPQCKQRIHPVLNIFIYIFIVYLILFFNRMILNSGRHIKLFDLFDARFLGLEMYIEFGLPKEVLPSIPFGGYNFFR